MRAATVGLAILVSLAAAVPAQAAEPNVGLSWGDDKVYVVDGTNTSRIPVNKIAEQLDENSPLNLVRIKGTPATKCPAPDQCIYISLVDYEIKGEASKVIGTTSNRTRDGRLIRSDIIIERDWVQTASSSLRDYITCHEVAAHGLGLGHIGSKDDHQADRYRESCRYWTTRYGKPAVKLSAADFRELNRRY